MTREELERKDLVNTYIDFQAICEDFDLVEGGIAPEQLFQLEELLIQFVQQNKY